MDNSERIWCKLCNEHFKRVYILGWVIFQLFSNIVLELSQKLCTYNTNIPLKFYWSWTISSPSAFALKSCISMVKYAVIRIRAHLLIIHYNSSVPLLFNNLIYKVNFCRRFFHISNFELERNCIGLHGFLKKLTII